MHSNPPPQHQNSLCSNNKNEHSIAYFPLAMFLLDHNRRCIMDSSYNGVANSLDLSLPDLSTLNKEMAKNKVIAKTSLFLRHHPHGFVCGLFTIIIQINNLALNMKMSNHEKHQ